MPAETIILTRIFRWLVEPKLAGCGSPASEAAELWDRNFVGRHSHTSALPSPGQLNETVDFIEACNADSKPLPVHCRAGKGRAAAVLAAYLARKGLTAHDAIGTVRELRPCSKTPRKRTLLASTRRR